MLNRFFYYIFFISTIFITQSFFAQEPEEVLVTATRGSLNSSNIISSVTQLSSQDLSEQQATIITDALQGEPGVFIQQTTPGQGTAIVRGLKGSEILHLVDGMRLNNALFRNAPNQYLALVDPWIVERAEVVRGPVSTLYGSDAMGGVVHLLSGRPDFSGDIWSSKLRTRLNYDSSNLGKSLHTAASIGNNRFASGLSLSYTDQGDVRAADRRVQAPTAFSSKAASMFITYEDDSQRIWDVSLQYLTQPDTPRFDELVPGFGQTLASSEEFSFSPNSRLFLHGVHRSSGYSPWIQDLEIHLGMQKMRDGRRTQDTGSQSVRIEDNRSNLMGLTLQATTEPMGSHTFDYGIDIYNDEVLSSRQELSIISNLTETVSARFPDGSSLNTYDVYLHDSIDFSDRAQIAAGIRLSAAEVKLSATENSPAIKLSNKDVSGSVGVVYSFNDRFDGTANLARGFRAPNIFDLGTLGTRPGNRFNIANPNLSPETVLTAELGMRFQENDFTFDVVFWKSDYQDKITSVFTGDFTPGGREIVQSQNASSVKLIGTELSSSWLINARHELSTHLNYTRGDTSISNAEKEPADRIPPLNGGFSWRYSSLKWWLQTELLFADKQHRLSARDVRDPRINPQGTAGWGDLNLSFGYEFNKNWHLVTRMGNVLDQSFRRHGSGLDAAGRGIKLTIEADY